MYKYNSIFVKQREIASNIHITFHTCIFLVGVNVCQQYLDVY